MTSLTTKRLFILAALTVTINNWTAFSFILRAFSPSPWLARNQWRTTTTTPFASAKAKPSTNASRDVVTQDNDEETIFAILLRDLQIEGVPLLEVDANQLHILQAALWTTLAEMATQTEEQKACLIFESIPVTALQALVHEFMSFKDNTTPRLAELQRFHLTMLGKGPAILIQVSSVDDDNAIKDPLEKNQMFSNKNTAAMKMFVDRMVKDKQILSDYPTDDSGTLAADMPLTRFTTCLYTDACHFLSLFWNSICQVLAPQQYQGDYEHDSLRPSIMFLLLPNFNRDDFARFVALAELVSRSFSWYQAGNTDNSLMKLELLHFHPHYDRDAVVPVDEAAQGHIPPLSWIRPMLELNGNTATGQTLSDDEIRLVNYLRRAPLPAVCIAPVELVNAGLELVNLEVNGKIQQVSGNAKYSKNAMEVTKEGERALQDALAIETSVVM